MKRIRILAIALIAAGVMGLIYDRFTYTEESHDLEIGSLEVSIKEKESVNIPVWCSVGVVAVGTILLLARRKA